MSSHEPQPAILNDGTITAILAAPPRLLNDLLTLSLTLPRRIELERCAGSFVLVRCGAQTTSERADQWSIYVRRPLFIAARPHLAAGSDVAHWQLCASPALLNDDGYRWLAERHTGESLNLTGPFGNGFSLMPAVRRLLLLAEPARLPLLIPLIDELLDRGGQVSLLLVEEPAAPADILALRTTLPLNVELHTLGSHDWQHNLAGSLRWADEVCTTLAPARLLLLAQAIRLARLRLESGFAQALVDADLACGFGACLACTVPLANGSLTRACVHGPVFDLLELAGRG